MKLVFILVLALNISGVLARPASVTQAHDRLLAAELKLYGDDVLMAATVYGMNYPTQHFNMSCKDKRLAEYNLTLPKHAKINKCQIAGIRDTFKIVVSSTSGAGLYYNSKAWIKMPAAKLPKIK